MEFFAKIEKDGTITAGPFEDDQTYKGITRESRFYAIIQEKVASGELVVEEYVESPSNLLQYLAQKRWEKETGGFEMNGMYIATDDRSQLKIAGARIKADSDASFTTPWKLPNGDFIELNSTVIIAISNAVLDHIHNCFTLESTLTDQINNGTITSTEEIDAALAV